MTINGYLILFMTIIAIAFACYLPIFFILLQKGKSIRRQVNYLLLGLSIFFIIFMTLILFNLPFDFSVEHHKLNLIPFAWLHERKIEQRVLLEIIPNIILFVPFGFFLPTVFKQTRKPHNLISMTFLLTFTIECTQYFIGRATDIDDIIANILGSIIGFCIFKVVGISLKNNAKWQQAIGILS